MKNNEKLNNNEKLTTLIRQAQISAWKKYCAFRNLLLRLVTVILYCSNTLGVFFKNESL